MRKNSLTDLTQNANVTFVMHMHMHILHVCNLKLVYSMFTERRISEDDVKMYIYIVFYFICFIYCPKLRRYTVLQCRDVLFLSLYVWFYVIYTFVKFCKLRILILMFMYSYCLYSLFCIFCFHRANWHSSTTQAAVFPCFFLSCKTNARV
jgi:hypothetical protein